jgi:mono/diheme cytochrome c family protein
VSTPKVIVSLLIGIAALLCAARSGADELSEYNGAQLYQRFCASCHGVRGLGDGPVAADLNVMVPDVTRIAHRHGGVYPAEDVRRIIDGRTVHVAHGTRDMPVWGYEFRLAGATDTSSKNSADELVRRLVDYLRSIQVK